MASSPAKLTTGSIPRHLVTQTLPMMIGGAALMSVGIIDAYFVGQLGPDALAAISFIFPVTVALSSLGVGVLAGISSVLSRALGEGDELKAMRRGALGALLAGGLGIAIAAGLYFGSGALFRAMQAQERLIPLILDYMQPFALGFPLLLVGMAANGSLRAQGLAKQASMILMTLAAANWVLDPLLITGAFGFEGFGMAGAAYATVGGWIAALAIGLPMLQRSDVPLRPSLLTQCHVGAGTKALVRVAGPAALANAVNPIGLSVLTGLLAATAGAEAVAGYGAGGRLQAFAVVPLLGLSASIGPIVGQNFGAGAHERVRQALLLAGGFCIAYGIAVGLALIAASGPLATLFTEDPVIRAAIGEYLFISAWGYAGFGLLIVSNGALNALDHAGFALGQSVARVLLVMVPVAWWLGAKWGANGVYVGELAANLIGGVVAALVVWRLAGQGR